VSQHNNYKTDTVFRLTIVPLLQDNKTNQFTCRLLPIRGENKLIYM